MLPDRSSPTRTVLSCQYFKPHSSPVTPDPSCFGYKEASSIKERLAWRLSPSRKRERKQRMTRRLEQVRSTVLPQRYLKWELIAYCSKGELECRRNCEEFRAVCLRRHTHTHNITNAFCKNLLQKQHPHVPYKLHFSSTFPNIHSFSSLSYDRSKASSKASSPHSAIQSFLFQMRVSSPFLKVIQ